MRSLRTRLVVLAAAGVVSTAGIGVAAAPAGARTVARCGNGALAVTRTFSQGAAGHGYLSLVYRNTTRHSCSVYGYPGLDAVTKSGHVLTHAKRTISGSGGRLHNVRVRPGGYASAGVQWQSFDGRTGGSCRSAAAISTIVANTTRAARVAGPVSVCGLQVHQTVAGTPGYRDYGPAQRWWIRGSHASSAELNYYLGKAESTLKVSKDYPVQVAELAQLISYPETDLTPAQVKQAQTDVRELDRFFATPGLY